MTNPLTEAKKALDGAEAAFYQHRDACRSVKGNCWVCSALHKPVREAALKFHQLLNDEDEK